VFTLLLRINPVFLKNNSPAEIRLAPRLRSSARRVWETPMKIKVILNPYANRWGAKKRIPEVESLLAASGLTYDLVVTAVPGQGIAEARLAADSYDVVVAAGGDSTVSEIVNGLILAASEGVTRPLAVLPLGTGNDFSDMTGVPRDLTAAIELILSGKTRQIDAGQVNTPNTHYFDNNCALAMEPMVSIENIKMTRLSGTIRYVVALARALRKLKAWHMHIAWDGGSFTGPTYLLSVCNSERTGGLFYMAPGARMDDGLLDFVLGPEMPMRQVLAILPRLFKGTHVNLPQLKFQRTTCLEVTSQPGTPIHADGELIAESATTIAYRILPGKITLLAPPVASATP
jgi:diacylglycerol kinase (ATP)